MLQRALRLGLVTAILAGCATNSALGPTGSSAVGNTDALPDGPVSAALSAPKITASGSGAQVVVRTLGLASSAASQAPDLGIVVQLKPGATTTGAFGVQALESISSMPSRKILSGTYALQAQSTSERDAVIAQLKKDPDVAYVGVEHHFTITSTPNDPYYSQQWAFPKISAPQAWGVTTGSNVIIADVDTGVDYTHPDLTGQVIQGYNFVANNTNPMDDNGHGTHVAGILAASTNNGVGVAGTAYGAKILAIKALDANGSGTDATLAPAILYAANHGAKVISCSWGSPTDDPIIDQAIDQAIASGCIVVAAAGNSGVSTPFYPAGHSGVISVGATDNTDSRAYFSNYGSWVKIAAPGVGIVSTYPNNQYAQMDGTSMATPYVSGVTALIESLHPTWTPAAVEQQLLTTGDPASGFSNPSCLRVNAYKALGASAPAPGPTPAPTPAPSTGPTVVFSGVGATAGTGTATITWSTNLSVPCAVDFGPTSAYGWKTVEYSGATAHWTTFSGLAPATTYYYQLSATNPDGSISRSAGGTFTTP